MKEIESKEQPYGGKPKVKRSAEKWESRELVKDDNDDSEETFTGREFHKAIEEGIKDDRGEA